MINRKHVLSGSVFADSQIMFFAYRLLPGTRLLEVYDVNGAYVMALRDVAVTSNVLRCYLGAIGNQSVEIKFALGSCRLLDEKELVPFQYLLKDS